MFFVTKDAYGGLGPGLYKVCGIVETGIGLYDKNTFYAPLPAVNEQLALDDGALEIVCRVKGVLMAAGRRKRRLRESFESVETKTWRYNPGRNRVISTPCTE